MLPYCIHTNLLEDHALCRKGSLIPATAASITDIPYRIITGTDEEGSIIILITIYGFCVKSVLFSNVTTVRINANCLAPLVWPILSCKAKLGGISTGQYWVRRSGLYGSDPVFVHFVQSWTRTRIVLRKYPLRKS